MDEDVRKGQAVYSVPFLGAWYDLYVLGLNNHLVWRCPTRHLVAHYRQHLSANHLEAGVGSGYLLARCTVERPTSRLVLLDLNDACLALAARRLAPNRPACVRCNLLEPLPVKEETFDSVGFNYVLHCLPGAIPAKAVVLDHLRTMLRPGGVIFGATLLAGGVQGGLLARCHLKAFNTLGMFSNLSDTRTGLQRALEQRFADASVVTIGSAALFSARKP